MLTVQEIKKFINNDAASTKKRLAKVGLRYYEGNHDINNYRIFFFDADGTLQEDKTKSNIRISHPFFKLLTDQQAQYMWEFWLHRDFERSFSEFCNATQDNTTKPKTASRKELVEIVRRSMEITSFVP